MASPVDGLGFHELFNYAGYGLMGLLTMLGRKIWKDVELLKAGWLTREEFNKKIENMETERDKRHDDNTGNFKALHESVTAVERKYLQGQIEIERRLGEVLTKIEGLKPSHRPDGGPERRRGY